MFQRRCEKTWQQGYKSISCSIQQSMKFQQLIKNSKWVWSGITTITNRRQPRGTETEILKKVVLDLNFELSDIVIYHANKC